jgi:hypothetical protein
MRNENKVCLTCGKPCDLLRIKFKTAVLVRFCDSSCYQKYLNLHSADTAIKKEADQEEILHKLMTEEAKLQMHNLNDEAKKITQDMLHNGKFDSKN